MFGSQSFIPQRSGWISLSSLVRTIHGDLVEGNHGGPVVIACDSDLRIRGPHCPGFEILLGPFCTFTPHLIDSTILRTQEGVAPFLQDCKIVEWDIKVDYIQNYSITAVAHYFQGNKIRDFGFRIYLCDIELQKLL